MTSRLVTLGVGIGFALLASCGGGTKQPASLADRSGSSGDDAAPVAAASAQSAPNGEAAPPKVFQSASSATPDQPKPALALMVPLSSVEETFPSGLVVDQRELGGPAPGPELPKGTKVLHIGDSFGGALGIELNKVLTNAGVKSRLEFETSTYIPTWAYSKKLPSLLQSFNPDLVLISLGANELENPEPEKRAPLIKRLVASLGGRACVWVAPVLWDGAKNQLLDVIAANSSPCVYLDSNRIVKKMPRAGDKIHPSMQARPDWALVTARWLAYHRRQSSGRPWEIVAVL